MRIGIHHKITLAFSFVVVLMLVGTYSYLNSTLTSKSYENIKDGLARETLLAKSFIETCMRPPFTCSAMDQVADDIGSSVGLRATIIALDGRVLGDSSLTVKEVAEVESHLYRPEVQEALKTGMGESSRFSTTIKDNLLYVARVFGDPEPEGVIRLAMPLSEIRFISGQLRKVLLIASVAGFAAAIGMAYVMSLFISKPVKQISWAAREIAGGDFTRRIIISADDEIGDLASAFNHMSGQVRNRIQEVVANKSRLEAVLLSMFDGVMVVNFKNEIILMNEKLKQSLLMEGDPSGKSPMEVIRNVEIQAVVEKVLKGAGGVVSQEISLLLPEEKILLVHATPVVQDSKTEGAVLVFHDITELRRLERVRRDFVANVSHELRTPVSNIHGYAETLLDGAVDDKKHAAEFVGVIHKESGRLAKIIQDLLNLAGMESGRTEMNFRPCALASAIAKSLSGMRQKSEKKHISIETEIPEGLAPLLADEDRIVQVLTNLLDNAVNYTSEGGRVAVSAEDNGGYVVVRVTDNGTGIPSKDLPRIFERFYRAGGARSDEHGGTGLGLSIVRHIVQAHGGEVSVESIEGQGSSFSFSLPKA
ncbi:MAG: ATP-binding protein [Candidatus Omnitrophota bacterium]